MGSTVEGEHVDIRPSDNQERGGPNDSQRGTGEVRPAPTRDDRENTRFAGRRDQRRGCTSAGTEVPERQPASRALRQNPISDAPESVCQQSDIEPEVARVAVFVLFVQREQVNEQGCQTRTLENLGHISVSGAVSAAATAVSEQHRASGIRGHGEVAWQCGMSRNWNHDRFFIRHDALLVGCPARGPPGPCGKIDAAAMAPAKRAG
jgi:hypothetical protein